MGRGNVKREVSGAGGRIKDELKSRGRSVRDLQVTLEKKGVRGSAYSTVWKYMENHVEPAAEFVRAAADELGLREEYLLKGQYPKSVVEGRVTKQENLRPGSPLIDEVLDNLGWSEGPRALFHEAWRRYAAGAQGKRQLLDAQLIQLGATLLMLVEVPKKIWGFQHTMSGRQRDDYAVAMLHALMLAMPDAGHGDRISDRGKKYPTHPSEINWKSSAK